MEVIGNHERADYLPVPYAMRHVFFYDFHKLNSEFCSLSVTREVDGAQLPRLSTLNPSIRSGGSNIRQTFALIRAIVLRVLVNRLSATPALFTASVAGVPRR